MPLMIFFVLATHFVLVFLEKNGLATLHSYKNSRNPNEHSGDIACDGYHKYKVCSLFQEKIN